MKLLYITTKISGAGGVQRVVLAKAAYLAEKLGYTVTIVTTNPDNNGQVVYDVSPSLTLDAIEPVKTNTLHYLQSYKKLLNKKIELHNPDIIIMCDNGFKSFLLPFIIKQKKVLIYERHTPKVIQQNDESSNFLKYAVNRFTSVFITFCASRFDKFVVLTADGAKEWKINNSLVIPNPLWFSTTVVSTLGYKKVIAVGRHCFEKGYDRMFTIWKSVQAKYPDWTLTIYGDDDENYSLKQMALDSGITSGIEFKPSVKDIVPVYQDASIYIMTSRYEGFGMVLLEAMGCGLPCVAFDCPVGPKDIINDGQDGYLISDGDTNAFVAVFSKLMHDKALRTQMGDKAKARSADFEMEPIMQTWDKLFKSLL